MFRRGALGPGPPAAHGVAEARRQHLLRDESAQRRGPVSGCARAGTSWPGASPAAVAPEPTRRRDEFPAPDPGPLHPGRRHRHVGRGALRDRNEPHLPGPSREAIDNRERFVTVELLYSDQVGGQRTISRFGLIPYERQGRGRRDEPRVVRDHQTATGTPRPGPGPRSDDQVAAAHQRGVARNAR